MNMIHLALRNITGNTFRSWVVASCAFVLACISISSTLVYYGVKDTMRQINERLGADIMVIPPGARASVENALLMGVPASVWMDRSVLEKIQSLPEVAVVSPQLFLSTMRGASCCSVSDMFMVAIDPATDFTVQPWLDKHLGRELQLNEAIGGCFVYVPEERSDILVYGNALTLVGNLEPTGSGLDQSMFITFDTAMVISRLSPMQAERELFISPDSISAALVKVRPDAEIDAVAARIAARLPELAVVKSANLFSQQRSHVNQMLGSATVLFLMIWLLSMIVIGLITSAAIAERRQQIGVLRALGARRSQVFLSLLMEGEIVALAGGASGLVFAGFTLSLFRNLLTQSIGVPIRFPTLPTTLILMVFVLVMVFASIFTATIYPILHLAAREPGTSLKEG